MADLKILTYNVQGIGGIGKRTDIFEFLKNMDFDTDLVSQENKPCVSVVSGENQPYVSAVS